MVYPEPVKEKKPVFKGPEFKSSGKKAGGSGHSGSSGGGRCRCVTRFHEIGHRSHHAVPSISLKTVVGVNLGGIEIFALCRSSVIFTPYTCSFLIVFDP